MANLCTQCNLSGISASNVIVAMAKEIKDKSKAHPNLAELSPMNCLFRRKKCKNWNDGVSPEALIGLWYKLVLKVVCKEIPSITTNKHHPFAKLLENEAKRGKGKDNYRGITVEELLGCTLERFLKYDFLTYFDLPEELFPLYHKRYLEVFEKKMKAAKQKYKDLLTIGK